MDKDFYSDDSNIEPNRNAIGAIYFYTFSERDGKLYAIANDGNTYEYANGIWHAYSDINGKLIADEYPAIPAAFRDAFTDSDGTTDPTTNGN
jgi:hypothetical protein